jgi:IS30 family transposase
VPAEARRRTGRCPGIGTGTPVVGRGISPVATLVEPSTGYLMLVGLPDGHRAELVADAPAAAITTLPRQLTRSLTWDQGHQMAEHARFSIDTGIAVYFCDPNSPWLLSFIY